MFESLISSVVLGITAGLCPLNLFFIIPIFPKVLGEWAPVNTIIFSLVVSTVFIPLGLLVILEFHQYLIQILNWDFF